MADAPTRNSRRRRPLLGKGAPPTAAVARPDVSSTTDPDASRIRRFGRMLMHRGETETKGGDFTEAALQFERAAWAYEYLNDPLAAAEATLELGRCLLYLGHGGLLPALAGRIDNLAREAERPLPEGGLLQMRVWAAILRKGEAEPSPFLQLIRMRRRARSAGASTPRSHSSGGLPLIDFVPPHSLIPPAGLSASPADDWTLSPDGQWFVCEIADPSPAERIERGRRVIDLGRQLECPARWEIGKGRVLVKVAADRRGYSLISALRGEAGLALEQEAAS